MPSNLTKYAAEFGISLANDENKIQKLLDEVNKKQQEQQMLLIKLQNQLAALETKTGTTQVNVRSLEGISALAMQLTKTSDAHGQILASAYKSISDALSKINVTYTFDPTTLNAHTEEIKKIVSQKQDIKFPEIKIPDSPDMSNIERKLDILSKKLNDVSISSTYSKEKTDEMEDENKTWEFDVKRDENGYMTKIIATGK